MSTTEALARLIVQTDYDSMPSQVIQEAKAVFLDGVGVMLAGSREQTARAVAEYVREMGGPPRCTVYGHGFATSPVMAAFANGVSGHVLDYEAMWHPSTHPTSPTLPVVLALAEMHGLSGREVLAALIVGFEVQGRIRLASARVPPTGFHPPGVVGVMGSAAASARLLGLDSHQTQMSLAIAASRAGGLAANIGTMTKSTHCGNAARMGLEAALLAEKGFTGVSGIVEHPTGYARVLFGEAFDPDSVTRDFGRPYRLVEPGVAIKRYPSQYGTHRAIEAALELRHRHGIQPDRIDRVTIEAPVMSYVDRPSPGTGLEGKFSFQYTVAAALLDGEVTIGSFSDQRRFSADIGAMLDRIDLHMDPAIPPDFQEMWVSVEVRLVDGRSHAVRCDRPRGIWGSPLSRDERLSKFRDCASRVLPAVAVEKCIGLIEGLEGESDVSELIEIMGTSSQMSG